jgi:hypothetical protein
MKKCKSKHDGAQLPHNSCSNGSTANSFDSALCQ